MLLKNGGGEFMERDRSGKIIAIVALLVGVAGLTLGFAAFSNTLTIQSKATVTPDDSVFNVAFSNENAVNKVAVTTGGVVPTKSPSTNAPAGFTASTATIANDNQGGPLVSDIDVTFTEPGQSVVYEFYVKNIGELDAFLTNINMANASGGSSFKKCAKVTEGKTEDEIATDSLVDAACEEISLTFKLNNVQYTSSTARAAFTTATQHDLSPTDSQLVQITVAYAANAPQADGDFTVSFGDIQLQYKSVAS